VIGTVGSEAKAELARAHGCHHTVLYRDEDVAAKVREITDGEGVDVAYDSVGAQTFEGSLDSLRPRGLMVSFGNASGPVDPFSPLLLAKKGSLFMTRPRLIDHYSTQEETADGIGALFDMVTTGKILPYVDNRFSLAEAAKAHIELEARKTVGSTVLIA
jgi:NADPH2:quinone reductase